MSHEFSVNTRPVGWGGGDPKIGKEGGAGGKRKKLEERKRVRKLKNIKNLVH